MLKSDVFYPLVVPIFRKQKGYFFVLFFLFWFLNAADVQKEGERCHLLFPKSLWLSRVPGSQGFHLEERCLKLFGGLVLNKLSLLKGGSLPFFEKTEKSSSKVFKKSKTKGNF